MNYRETLEYFYSQLPAYHRVGKAAYKSSLFNTLELDNHLGHPHTKFRTIHVAGTNGKGSVSHMLASVLMEAGYKTGLYTSPHLKDFRERIRVDGQMIPESAITGFVSDHYDFMNTLKLSFFEMTVGMAFDFFAKSNVDVAVIEVGLGGRLDSTNIINPVLSVITNIGHDHMDILGDSFEKIAGEKAGIIKNNIPVVISETHEETKNVFVSRARETGSEIYFADQNYRCILDDYDSLPGKRAFIAHNLQTGKSYTGETGLGGDYQSRNLQAVLQACSVLKSTFRHTEKNLLDGICNVIENTHLSGRWQILGSRPLTICDTGHNKEGLGYVVKQLSRIPNTKLRMVIGFVNDKDLSLVLPLLPVDAVYYFTKASVPRALNENILKAEAAESGLRGSCYSDVKSAIMAARSEADDTDLIFVGGSTFIVADAI